MSEKSAPIVFISYSRESETHKNWVLRLATDLRANGIDVILDQWMLRVGENIGHFMETSVTKSDYLLLVCTDSYAIKANTRYGGVGYEHEVITGHLLTDTAANAKLVPVLRSGSPAKALPNYLKTRLFVDFRLDESYDRSVEQLLRHFYGAPESVMPPLGPSPSFVMPRVVLEQQTVSPKKWVLVAGTGDNNAITDQERETSIQTGKIIAKNTLGLVTGGWPGVDDIVGRAFADEAIRLGLPLENFLIQIVAESWLPTFPAGDLILVQEGTAEWTEGICRANGIVLIGGLGGTLMSGRLAAEQRKPVFPLADTGRDAKKFYVEILKNWERLGPPGIAKAKFQRMARPAPAVVADLAELLRAL